MAGTFHPEIWDKNLLNTLRHSLGPADERYRRKGHTVVTQYTDAELQARDEAIAEWQQLTDNLVTAGYLVDEIDGIYTNTETEHREWVYDETPEQYEARVNPTGKATYTFKTVDR